jgi:glucose-1-phosphate thymidylyltransferase
MKGVVLAGGLGTRLRPQTHITNKHLLLVYDKPMIFYPIDTLVKADIRDVLIVVGGNTDGFIKLLGEMDLGVKDLQFKYQRGEGGISDALSLAEDFANGESVCVILGDNCTDAEIKSDVKNFRSGAKIFLKRVDDPERFGVPIFGNDNKILRIEEKPSSPSTNYAVTGLYIFDETVFDRIKTLSPSARGELEVTDLINTYINDGKLSWGELNGFWRDAGTFESLAEVYAYWAGKGLATRGKERR